MQTLHPVTSHIGIRSFLSLGTTIIPPLFGHVLNMTRPTTVCNRINGSCIQPLDDLNFHYLLHRRIQPSLVLNNWFVIRHELDLMGTETGGMQIMFIIVQLMAHFNLFNTTTWPSTCRSFKFAAIITGEVSFLPKNTYLR